MAWHSTKRKEELLLGLAGTVAVEVCRGRRVRRLTLRPGRYVFLPQETRHRVVNRSPAPARYLYITVQG
jgi:mannose-6-phosphate isomerase-like protein (cupin superfamily)